MDVFGLWCFVDVGRGLVFFFWVCVCRFDVGVVGIVGGVVVWVVVGIVVLLWWLFFFLLVVFGVGYCIFCLGVVGCFFSFWFGVCSWDVLEGLGCFLGGWFLLVWGF